MLPFRRWFCLKWGVVGNFLGVLKFETQWFWESGTRGHQTFASRDPRPPQATGSTVPLHELNLARLWLAGCQGAHLRTHLVLPEAADDPTRQARPYPYIRAVLSAARKSGFQRGYITWPLSLRSALFHMCFVVFFYSGAFGGVLYQVLYSRDKRFWGSTKREAKWWRIFRVPLVAWHL